jgi:hypothetical protein
MANQLALLPMALLNRAWPTLDLNPTARQGISQGRSPRALQDTPTTRGAANPAAHPPPQQPTPQAAVQAGGGGGGGPIREMGGYQQGAQVVNTPQNAPPAAKPAEPGGVSSNHVVREWPPRT